MGTNPPNWARPHQSDDTSNSEVFRAITNEWARLCELPSGPVAITRWERDHPVLAEATTLPDLLDLISDSEAQVKDDVLHALVAVFRAGDALAGQVVLQAMLPKLAKMCRQTSRSPECNTTQRDWHHTVVADFWVVLGKYPIHPRPQKVAAWLALTTLNVITHHLRAGVTQYAGGRQVEIRGWHPSQEQTAEEEESTSSERSSRRSAYSRWDRTTPVGASQQPNAAPVPELEVYEVLAWGVDAEAISRDEAALLVQVYVPEVDPPTGRAQAAAMLGITEEAVRARCSRAARRLAAAVRLNQDDALSPAASPPPTSPKPR